MRALVFLLVFAFLIPVHLNAKTVDQPKSITIGIIPSDNQEKLKKVGLEFAKILQERLGIQVNVLVPKTYTGLIEAMKTKKVDFGFFTAMSFVFAEKEAGAKVLLKKVWKNPYYYSTIYVLKDSGITKIEDLKGKVFSFVDEKSTSGYLYPRAYIQRKGIDHKSFFSKILFGGNHEESVKALMGKKADAAAFFADDPKAEVSAWSNFATGEMRDKGTPIWVSPPIPNDPFCVRQDFYEKYPRITHDLMLALIDLSDQSGPDGGILKRLFDISRLETATSRQYEPVREMVRELKLGLDK